MNEQTAIQPSDKPYILLDIYGGGGGGGGYNKIVLTAVVLEG